MRFGARFQPWVKLSKYLSQAILATPALIKVDEIGQNQQKKAKLFKTGAIIWEKAQCVNTVTKKALSLATSR